ncbi:MAG: MFS transporter [Bacteroidales bacterium]|nr:MFS transporter [Bacteroidales bacterium]
MGSDVKKTNWRWAICALLFVATTINYMDRQVLSLTWKDFIAVDFHWSDSDYGTITGAFSIFYAVACLFAGKFIDWMGTRRGYLVSIFAWSVGACLHAACGWAAMRAEGIEDMEALRNVQAGSAAALAISTISVYLFLGCRMMLALGESGNFPAAIKVTAEYFPKKDRAFATSIFNAGASVGALAAPATIPLLAEAWGWEMAFIIIGAMGFVWMFFWNVMYDQPSKSRHVNAAELEYVNQDYKAESAAEEGGSGKTIPFFRCLGYRQTWSFVVGKFFTDGVWWFYLFWAPAYFSDQYGLPSNDPLAIGLISTLYAIVTILSIGGGYLPKYFVERRGMETYRGRMLAMLIFACFPLFALVAQPLGQVSPWWPAIIIGLAGAGHQAWSANLYSTIGDMFPKSTIATITGIGTTVGGIGSFLINKGSGMLFSHAAGTTVVDGREVEMTRALLESGATYARPAMEFLSFSGKEAGYMIVFCICAVTYVVAWVLMKALVPRYKPIEI